MGRRKNDRKKKGMQDLIKTGFERGPEWCLSEMRKTTLQMRAETDQKIAEMHACYVGLTLAQKLALFALVDVEKFPESKDEYTMLVALAQIGRDEVVLMDARKREVIT